MNGHWKVRNGSGCEVISYILDQKVMGVLVRSEGTDKWTAKIGGVPIGEPTSKGNAEKQLRTKVRSERNIMTKAELEQRVAYLESLVRRDFGVQTPVKKSTSAQKAVKVQARGRKLKSPEVYPGGPTWGQVRMAKAIVSQQNNDLRPSEFKAAVNAVLAKKQIAPLYR